MIESDGMFEVKTVLKQQKIFFDKGKTKNINFRIAMLRKLRDAIKAHEEEILEALRRDLNKSAFEAYETEIGMVLHELSHVLKHLPGWAKPKYVGTPVIHFPSVSYITAEPYGSVLIMAPWNYPFQLAINPLVGALAGGNCCVLKPSAYACHTAAVIHKIISGIFDESYVAVALGGREANKNLLDEKFDYIFFTGGFSVGQVVMEAAAKHLTPVTLELGGKSPCIVDCTANIRLAARRIVWGKFLNAGQTCVAPDYLLVHTSVKAELLREMTKCIMAFYGDAPETNKDYPRIINQKHFKRLSGLLAGGTAVTGGQLATDGQIVTGGRINRENLQIAPTILDHVQWDDEIMKDEIFGPILPVIEFENLGEALAEINRRPKPLAFYYFTTSRKNAKYAVQKVSFGGGVINDVIIHLANPHLPFGGVGSSGIGQYHGRSSYDTFTHSKSIMRKSNRLDIPLRYPPFKDHLKLLKRVLG